ncbi:MAG: efflux transporter outer membrane subunit [Stenotrophobium sp.]
MRGGNFHGSAALALAGALLGGCASMAGIRPAAQPADVNRLNAGHEISNSQRADVAWPTAQWWRAYDDAQLDALVAKAVAGNPRLAQAINRIAGARAAANGVRAATLPGVKAQGSFIDSRFSENQFFPPPYGGNSFWNNDAELDLSYDLDLWGRNRSALAAALDAVQIASAEAQQARLALEGAVVRSYADLSYQFDLKDNLNAILGDEKQSYDIAHRRRVAGLGSELEEAQAQTAISATEAQMEQVEARMAILRHQLAALSGGGPGDGDAFARPALHFDATAVLPGNIPAHLLGRRPDIVAQRWRVERAARGIDVAKASFYPDINLTAFAGLLSLGFSQFLSTTSTNTGIGPAISLPVFDGGRLRAGLQASTAEYDSAVHAYDATLIGALNEVADRIAELRSLAVQAQKRGTALAAAERAHELALKAFRGGLTDYLNVLSTESALNAERGLLAEIHFHQAVSAAALNVALGGGYIENPGPAAASSTTAQKTTPGAPP